VSESDTIPVFLHALPDQKPPHRLCSRPLSPSPHSAAPPPEPTAITPGIVPEGYTTIQEGSARILQRGNEVFYNPVQVRREPLVRGGGRGKEVMA
jgi:hypothetical protein